MAVKTIKSVLFSSLVKPFLSQGRRPARVPLAVLLLGAAIAAWGATTPAQADSLTVAQTGAESVLPAAERYLFGQTPQPDQIGQGYVVLERTGDRVYGALYYPSSSFDCFYGQVQGSEVAMTIINSYDQEAYPYSLALAEGPAVATVGSTGESLPFSLDGFYAIDTLSDNDHRMLDQCRAAVTPML
ncbi:hypothetical protein IQ254_22780 [Nodosilinea sp. LEGE 07088]|uniref:hypothetical protein n=1 Tax=Nodosilinea sp. LEGE 07088 TaxID=2777968 RepID=UPI00187ED530|nr:hypothetical protein [Nodosilinea sp. LEGE 07088]MBE9139985.1 hypothetical protein [Nodosilinea sp. LEGE 07088]